MTAFMSVPTAPTNPMTISDFSTKCALTGSIAAISPITMVLTLLNLNPSLNNTNNTIKSTLIQSHQRNVKE